MIPERRRPCRPANGVQGIAAQAVTREARLVAGPVTGASAWATTAPTAAFEAGEIGGPADLTEGFSAALLGAAGSSPPSSTARLRTTRLARPLLRPLPRTSGV